MCVHSRLSFARFRFCRIPNFLCACRCVCVCVCVCVWICVDCFCLFRVSTSRPLVGKPCPRWINTMQQNEGTTPTTQKKKDLCYSHTQSNSKLDNHRKNGLIELCRVAVALLVALGFQQMGAQMVAAVKSYTLPLRMCYAVRSRSLSFFLFRASVSSNLFSFGSLVHLRFGLMEKCIQCAHNLTCSGRLSSRSLSVAW